MKLPAEIRNRIYEYVVVCEGAIDIVQFFRDYLSCLYRDTEGTGTEALKQALQQPALTRTCKTLRSEALPMFYGLNAFNGSLVDTCYVETCYTLKWLRDIDEHLKLLKKFTSELGDTGMDVGVKDAVEGLKYNCKIGKLITEDSEIGWWPEAEIKFEEHDNK